MHFSETLLGLHRLKGARHGGRAVTQLINPELPLTSAGEPLQWRPSAATCPVISSFLGAPFLVPFLFPSCMDEVLSSSYVHYMLH